MKCLILAAGYATRLYPLTENFPKPLLPVGEKNILEWLIEDIGDSVDEFILISNHKYYEHFKKWSLTRKEKITLLDDGSVSNETRLGAVRDIWFAIDTLKLDDELLVIAGDNVLDFSLRSFIDYYHERNTSCIMRYYEPSMQKLQKTGVIEANEDDLVINMEEKPERPRSNWCAPPFYIFTRKDVSLVDKGIKDGCGTDAPGSFVAWLAKQVEVHAYEMPGRRYDIGNLESYQQVLDTYKGIENK
ncbi:MAG: nucleotidyltransferase family protein [Erysipelotrichaceae bacterium]|nr:nucleotidyltransferase family protein [Erysipelotrichaceae bacterium]